MRTGINGVCACMQRSEGDKMEGSMDWYWDSVEVQDLSLLKNLSYLERQSQLQRETSTWHGKHKQGCYRAVRQGVDRFKAEGEDAFQLGARGKPCGFSNIDSRWWSDVIIRKLSWQHSGKHACCWNVGRVRCMERSEQNRLAIGMRARDESISELEIRVSPWTQAGVEEMCVIYDGGREVESVKSVGLGGRRRGNRQGWHPSRVSASSRMTLLRLPALSREFDWWPPSSSERIWTCDWQNGGADEDTNTTGRAQCALFLLLSYFI